MHNESDCRVYKLFMQNLNLIPQNDRLNYLKKNVFEVTCITTRPQNATRPILTAEEETDILNLIEYHLYLPFGKIGDVKNLHDPSGVDASTVKAGSETVETLTDIRTSFMDYIRSGDRHWSYVLRAVEKFEAKQRFMKTFRHDGIVIEVVFTKVPTIVEEINDLRATKLGVKRRRDDHDNDPNDDDQGPNKRVKTDPKNAENNEAGPTSGDPGTESKN